MADFHARAVNEHPGAELVAAANWRPESLERLAARHGIPAVTEDWRSLASFRTVHHVDWNLTMAAALVFMLPVIVIFFLAQRVFIEGITLTGVKG